MMIKLGLKLAYYILDEFAWIGRVAEIFRIE
jgi:hypothetical protein